MLQHLQTVLFTRQQIPGALLLLISLLINGCSNNSLPGKTGTLTGEVINVSGSVPAGTTVILMHKETGIIATGVTDSNGKFRARMRGKELILVGDYEVGVTPAGEYDEALKEPPDTWKAIPQKYWSPATSNEIFVVKTGKNFYSLALTN